MDSPIIVLPALIRLLYATGLRIGEALSLKDREVHLDDEVIIVRDSKNRKERLIPISSSLSTVLREYTKYKQQLPIKKMLTAIFLSAYAAWLVNEMILIGGSKKSYVLQAYRVTGKAPGFTTSGIHLASTH